VKEEVLVFPAGVLTPYLDHFQDGLATNPAAVRDLATAALDPSSARFVDRGEAEGDPSFKQIIPYCILRKSNHVFAYQRTKNGGESRLYDRWTLGVGGHINPVDGEVADGFLYGRSVLRELAEEVGLWFKKCPDLTPRAVIYTPQDEVGKVHVGFVHVLEVPASVEFVMNDPALAHGSWMGHKSLWEARAKFEGWSKLVIEKIFPPVS
jgi:predicted NUDIX family phosphoesterase